MTDITVSVSVKVKDEARLRQAVRDHLLESGIDPQDANACLDSERVTLEEVARLAIDTGETPAGCEVHDSWAVKDPIDPPQGIVAKLLEGTDVPGAYAELCRVSRGGMDPNVILNAGFSGPVVWIGHIESRVKGAGKSLMERICANADRLGVLLTGALDDDGRGKLGAWYEQFGFVIDEFGGERIERLPQGLVTA